MAQREQRALDNCRKAIDMQEIYERVAIHNHGSFLPHAAVYKVTRDILEVGDVLSFDISPLELHNAVEKRCFECQGARATEFRDEGTTNKLRADGTSRLLATKGYKGTAAVTTLTTLLMKGYLRRGDGLFSFAACRRNERLFGECGKGGSQHSSPQNED